MIPIVSNSNGPRAILLSFAAIFMLLGCAPRGYVKYRPVDADMHRSGYFFSKVPISIQHRENIKFVFDYYGIKYIEKDSQTIFIPSSVMRDTNYLYNCTMKANSPTWLAYKKKELKDGVKRSSQKKEPKYKSEIVAHSSKGQFKKVYFVNEDGDIIVEADTNQIAYLKIISKNMIGDSVDVSLYSEDFILKCRDYTFTNSQLKNLEITADTMCIEFEFLDKK